MAGFLDKLKGAVSEWGKARRALESKIEALKTERERLKTAPPNREDMAAAMLEYVDCCQTYFQRNLERQCEMLSNHPFWSPTSFEGADASKGRFKKINLLNNTGDWQANQMISTGAMAEPLKAAIIAGLETMDLDDSPPVAGRLKRIAEIDRELEKHQRELSDLRDSVNREMRG